MILLASLLTNQPSSLLSIHLVSQPVKQPNSHQDRQSESQLDCQSASKPASQYNLLPISQLYNKPAIHSAIHLNSQAEACHLVSPTFNQSTSQPAIKPTSEAANKTARHLTRQLVSQIFIQSTNLQSLQLTSQYGCQLISQPALFLTSSH